MADEPIIRTVVVVPAEQAHAFQIFTEDFGEWWPRDYTWSRDRLAWIGMERTAGGRCTEIGPDRFTCDWGHVLTWNPPALLQLAWQVSPRREPEPDPERASVVSVRFEPLGAHQCRVKLEHAHLCRHGRGSGDYRAAMGSPEGWPFIMQCYADHVRSELPARAD